MIQKSPNIGYGICVRRWSEKQFPGQWIGRRGPVERSPRSPDLTLVDFLLVGGFKVHGVTGKNTKRGTPKRTHYRCFCVPNTRCAKANSPWMGEKNPYVPSKYCCPYRTGLVNKMTIFPIYWDFRITLYSKIRVFWNVVLCRLEK